MVRFATLCLVAASLSCEPLENNCEGGLVLEGTAADLQTEVGEFESYELDMPEVCGDGTTALTLRSVGGEVVAIGDARIEELLIAARDALVGEDILIYGPGRTTVSCASPIVRSDYHFVIQMENWHHVDRVIEVILAQAAARSIAMTAGIEVGMLILCPLGG